MRPEYSTQARNSLLHFNELRVKKTARKIKSGTRKERHSEKEYKKGNNERVTATHMHTQGCKI